MVTWCPHKVEAQGLRRLWGQLRKIVWFIPSPVSPECPRQKVRLCQGWASGGRLLEELAGFKFRSLV